MSTIIELPNYFEPHTNFKHEVNADISILQWLEKYPSDKIQSHFEDGKWVAFELPTLVQINGDPVLQKDYDKKIIGADDIVTLTVLIGDPVTILVAVIVAVVATKIALSINTTQPSHIVNDTPQSDPIYSLNAQENAVKRGQPIPSSYGRVRNWPDYAALPNNRYIGNNQYQYSLYCLGHGIYDVSVAKLGDTPIENFIGVNMEVYLPGEPVTLFRNSVITADEVGGIELYGTNEDNYEGFSGPFIINDAFTAIDRIEIDLVLPGGLFYQNNNNGLSNRSVSWDIEYQSIDDNGDALGSWETLTEETLTLATNTTQRLTRALDVPLGRYQIRGVRTNTKDLTTRSANTLEWETARGFFPNNDNFGEVTIIAVEALATNNLNNNTKSEFNIIQHRRLPIYDANSQTWSEPTATRNLIDIYQDVMRSTYGGNYADAYFELDELAVMRNYYAVNQDNFDYAFTDAVNVWDASKVVLSVGRAIPMLNGSKLTAVQDKLETVPQHFFTPEYIIKDTFKRKLTYQKENDPDGVEIEFVDEDTWKPRTLLCTIGSQQGLRPKKEKVLGIINADKAYREGLHRAAKYLYQNQSTSFSTGLEGRIPAINTLVGIVHDVPRWGLSGEVVNKDGNTFTLNKVIEMQEGVNYEIGFKSRRGYALGPYAVFNSGESTDVILVSDAIPDDSEFERSQYEEPVVFVFGEENKVVNLARIVNVSPEANDEVRLDFVNDDPRIYSYDTEVAPPLDVNNNSTANEDLPVIASLTVSNVVESDTLIQATWAASASAVSYLLEISYDNIEFEQVVSTTATHHIFAVNAGLIYLRVAGVNVGIGAYATWSGIGTTADALPGEVQGFALVNPFTGVSIELSWDEEPLASSYLLRVLDSNDVLLNEIETTSTNYEYSNTEALVDFTSGINRTIKFNVATKNNIGITEPTIEITAVNPAPATPSSIVASVTFEDANEYQVQVNWSANTDIDFKEFNIYASDVTGFTADVSTLVATAGSNTALFTLAKPIASSNIYYRVEAVDVWGQDPSSMSSEQILTV